MIDATAAAVATPLCACGTTAVILGMMARMIPWAPIVAFRVASPLTSPEELVYSAGLFGWLFAIAFFVSFIMLGLLSGLAAGLLEARGWLKNQVRPASPAPASKTLASLARPARPARAKITRPEKPQLNLASSQVMASARVFGWMTPGPAAATCGCSAPAETVLETETCCAPVVALTPEPCACVVSSFSHLKTLATSGQITQNDFEATDSRFSPLDSRINKARVTPQIFMAETFATGKRLLFMFLGFAFIGYFLNGLVPPAWISAVFGQGSVYSVPLAATLGLPLYVNTEASLPLVRALIAGGKSQGAALAFLITGAGTSIGAIAGALTIARWRVIALVIGTLWVGSIAMGLVYNLLLAADAV